MSSDEAETIYKFIEIAASAASYEGYQRTKFVEAEDSEKVKGVNHNFHNKILRVMELHRLRRRIMKTFRIFPRT